LGESCGNADAGLDACGEGVGDLAHLTAIGYQRGADRREVPFEAQGKQAPPLQVRLGFYGVIETIRLVADGAKWFECDFSGVTLDQPVFGRRRSGGRG